MAQPLGWPTLAAAAALPRIQSPLTSGCALEIIFKTNRGYFVIESYDALIFRKDSYNIWTGNSLDLKNLGFNAQARLIAGKSPSLGFRALNPDSQSISPDQTRGKITIQTFMADGRIGSVSASQDIVLDGLPRSEDLEIQAAITDPRQMAEALKQSYPEAIRNQFDTDPGYIPWLVPQILTVKKAVDFYLRPSREGRDSAQDLVSGLEKKLPDFEMLDPILIDAIREKKVPQDVAWMAWNLVTHANLTQTGSGDVLRALQSLCKSTSFTSDLNEFTMTCLEALAKIPAYDLAQAVAPEYDAESSGNLARLIVDLRHDSAVQEKLLVEAVGRVQTLEEFRSLLKAVLQPPRQQMRLPKETVRALKKAIGTKPGWLNQLLHLCALRFVR